MITTDCIVGSLATYVPNASKPWDATRVKHLYRRLGFGVTNAEVQYGLTRTPEELVDELVNAAWSSPDPNPPSWLNTTPGQYALLPGSQDLHYYEWIVEWIDGMLTKGLREKLVLFWHNHFVTQSDAYFCPSYMYRYYSVLRRNAMGNFKTFVEEQGVSSAMLLFLNGYQNYIGNPNENYARELLELFTLGENNGYTQHDIVEVARALTGWVYITDFDGLANLCKDDISFYNLGFDDGPKTIFGQTGNWDYQGLHDVLFEQRAMEISAFIIEKLIKFFGSPQVDQTIIDELAADFRDNNWELEPVLRKLFKSEFFFDDGLIGSQIKSPVDYLLNYVKETGFPKDTIITTDQGEQIPFMLVLYIFAAEAGQTLFQPPDVAGWQGDRSWINSNTLTGRWSGSDLLIQYTLGAFPNLFVDLAKNLSNNGSDPALITQAIIDFLLPKGLQHPEFYDTATVVFKSDVPANYYTNGIWSLDYPTVSLQVGLLLQHIARMPESQLF